jgi:hypothetical protein
MQLSRHIMSIARKMFVFERLGKSPGIDAKRVASAIEATRFPPPPDRNGAGGDLEPRLVQAADLIGQLGDPLYARKANAGKTSLQLRPPGLRGRDKSRA